MPDGNTDTGPKRASSPEADFGAVCWCEGDIAKNRGRWHYSDLFQVCLRATRARVLSFPILR